MNSFQNIGLSQFGIVVNNAEGRAVPNAEVQLLGSDGGNYIGIVNGGLPTSFTNENGGIYFSPVPAGSVGPSVAPYTIRVIAEGYKTLNYLLPNTYTGPALIGVELERGADATDGYSLTGAMPRYRSGMYSTDLTAFTPHRSAWEIIQFLITRNADAASILEAPVLDDDGEGGVVRGDLRSRANLLPLAHLVPDGQVSRIDDDFSAVYTVSAKSLTDAGAADYDDTLTYFLANMVPPSGAGDAAPNDLSVYALPDPPARVKWITQLTQPIVFRGFYADVMIWLVDKSLSFQLITRYYDGAGTQVGSDAVATIGGDSRVLRIRLDSNPADGVCSATLQVYAGSMLYSETLTALYRG